MAVPAIGNVITPAGFGVFSAQGQVQISWNQTPLASTYYINRSVDNVTFVNIAQTNSITYNDTSAVVDTIYYYQVQASNGTASSQPTVSYAGLALKPGETTLANIRLQCQQRIDKIGTENITTQEWNSMIDMSRRELYDILVQKFGDDYYLAAPVIYTTAVNTQFYDLPADFYKMLGVEVALNVGAPNSWISLRKFMFGERNRWNYPNVYTMFGVTNLRYRIDGNSLYIVPPNLSSGTQIRIWYAPRVNQLLNDTDIVDCVSGWEEYIVADVCIKALAKEESDVTVFAAQKGALMKRIEEAAENRDIGDPEVVTDSKMRNGGWGDGPGGSGWGGGGYGW